MTSKQEKVDEAFDDMVHPLCVLGVHGNEAEKQLAERIAGLIVAHNRGEAPPAAAHGDEAVQYRLLRVGEIIQATDELLRDDCTTWQPMSDGPQIGIGRGWHAGLMPVRRIDAAMRAQGDGGNGDA